jgi:hypothetical protein
MHFGSVVQWMNGFDCPAYAFFGFYGLNLIKPANTAITNDSYHALHQLEHNCLGLADPPPSAQLSSTVAKSKAFLDPNHHHLSPAFQQGRVTFSRTSKFFISSGQDHMDGMR